MAGLFSDSELANIASMNARDKSYNKDNGLPGQPMLNSTTSYGGGGGMSATAVPYTPTAVPQKPPVPQFQPGQQVDLSGWKGAVNASKPGERQFNTTDLKTAMDTAAKNGQTTNLDWLRTALGNKPGDTFSLDQLKGSIDGAKTAAGAVPVQAYQYQNPEQFQKTLTMMNQVLAPLTQAQKGAAQASYGQASSQLADKWAANGLLASGGAAAQQQQGANALAQQMQGIEAQQQANALPMAFNFANLSLNEDQQKFGQNANNRDFAAQQGQNNVGNMLNALGLQGNQQQAWMQNAQNLAGMDIGQNQWAQQFGQQVKQAGVNNQLAGLGFEEGQLQNYLNNLGNVNQADMGQNQWAQQFGLQRQQSEMGNDLNWAQMQQQGNQFNANLGNNVNQFNANLANRQNEFGTGTMMDMLRMSQQQGQFQQGMDAQNKQSNWNAYKDSVGMTGSLGDGAKQDWNNLMQGQQYNPSIVQQNAMMGMMMDQANRFPFMPQNMSQYMGNMPAYQGMGGFLDNMGGQANQNTWNTQQQMNKWEQEFAFDKQYKTKSQGLQAAAQLQKKDYQQYLQDRQITGDKAKLATNNVMSDVMTQKDKQSAVKYLIDNQENLMKNGADINSLMKFVDLVWPQAKPTSGGASNNNIYQQLP